MKYIPFRYTDLGGFLAKRQEINRTASIPGVYNRFCDTGRFEAFRFNWKEGMDKKPHFFWDSDVAKWLESAAYSIEKHPDKNLEAIVDGVVDLIEKNQDENGYFNIYFTVCEPDKRFTTRDWHELYCCGHLIEAAVAYDEATGKNKFLHLMEKYVDYIYQRFVTEDSACFSTPGHEEIELALVKLFDHTGNEKYLELARHFINLRGTSDKDSDTRDWVANHYDQSHKPVREQTEAVGHSVRAVYLYSAMADLALRDNDKELYNACRKLIEDIAGTKMYITGGIGAASFGEQFSSAYDLPNADAYSESCASIGLALFARRMSLIEADSLYADIIERALYNNILASVSLDGKSFFYENPLEINLNARKTVLTYQDRRKHYPITQRLEVFGCSCCPPNITRFFASIADYIYTFSDDTLYVNQFSSCRTEYDNIIIEQKTEYPCGETVVINAESLGGRQLAVRIPGWCKSYAVKVNGCETEGTIKKGYMYLNCKDGDRVELFFDMSPTKVFANPRVECNLDRCAVQIGPVVYCLEGKDNADKALNLFSLAPELNPEAKMCGEFGMPVLSVDGYEYEKSDSLYGAAPSVKKTRLNLIPYFAFANRGETDMLVWIRN